MQVRGAPAVSIEECSSSLTVDSTHLPNSEVRMGLNMLVMYKKRQKQKLAFQMASAILNAKRAKAAPFQRKALPTVMATFVAVLDNEDVASSRWSIGEERRFLHAIADSETCSKVAIKVVKGCDRRPGDTEYK